MDMNQVKARAKSLGLKSVGVKKTKLIRSIQRAEGNFDCFDTADGYCDQSQCSFRSLCLKDNKK
jgi:hypothetical protein